MVKIERGIFDSGAFIHLQEINQLKLLEVVRKKYISIEVENELKHYRIPLKEIRELIIKNLSLENKNLAKFICEQYYLGLGEGTAIALAKQEGINLFFTDDLEAKETAKTFGLEAHGTLGLLTRALKEKKVTKEKAIKVVEDLSQNSSLFLTGDLVEWVIGTIKRFKGQE